MGDDPVRCLVTGITKQQCGGGTALGYEPVSDLFARGLSLASVTVDRGVWELGADPAQWDVLMIGLVPFFSINSNFLYHALDAIASAEEAGVPWFTFVDDWRFTQQFSNLATHIRHPHQLVKEFFKGRASYAWACENQGRLMAVTHRLAEKPWPLTVVPAFSWGDHEILRSQLRMSPDAELVDVSPLARCYDTEWKTPDERDKAWVLGTVSNQVTWVESLGLSWPVIHRGSKTSRAPEKAQEADLVAMYGENWGVLSPPYKAILGSGWWRNRFVYAARTGAIMLCDRHEAEALGEPYQLDQNEVETMPPDELDELAHAQRDAFFKAQASEAEVALQLRRAAQRVIEAAR